MNFTSRQKRLLKEAAEPMDKLVKELNEIVIKISENASEYKRINPEGDLVSWIPKDPNLVKIVNWQEVFEKAK